MKKIEISEYEYNELLDVKDKYYSARKKFMNLDKSHQELIETVTRYEQALNTLTWQFGCVSPEPMRMREIAKKALYNEK